MYTEAFKKLDLLCEEDFNLNDDEDLKNLKELNPSDMSTIDIIDPDASTEEDLKDSYIGQVILECPVCHSKFYKDKADVTLDEQGEWANEDEECPMCLSEGGFKIVGEIAPFKDDGDVTVKIDDDEVDVDTDDEEDNDTVEVNTEEDDEVADEGDAEKNESLTEGALGKGATIAGAGTGATIGGLVGGPIGAIAGGAIGGGLGMAASAPADAALDTVKNVASKADVEDVAKAATLMASDEAEKESQEKAVCPNCGKEPCECDAEVLEESECDESILATLGALAAAHPVATALGAGALGGLAGSALTKESLENNTNTPDVMTEEEAIKYWSENHTSDPVLAEYSSIIDWLKDSKENGYVESLNEGFEHVNVETEDQVMDMTQDENGKVTVTTEPKTSQESSEEMLSPIDFNTASDIVAQSDDETASSDTEDSEDLENEENFEDTSFDEFDEDSFNTVGESYLKENYDNVKSFKISKVRSKDNKLIVEGVINFNSGSKKKTSFIFEANSINKADKSKVDFLGENVEITKGKKAFKLNGQIVENKFISESLAYKYSKVKGIAKA